MQLFSIGAWLFAGLSFAVGVLVKYTFSKLLTPKLEIEKYVVLDKFSRPWIRVVNKSKRIKAYDLRLFIALYQNEQRIHTKVIKDGVLKNDFEEKYSLTIKKEKNEKTPYDVTAPGNHVEVTLIYKNRYNTFSIEEKTVVYKI